MKFINLICVITCSVLMGACLANGAVVAGLFNGLAAAINGAVVLGYLNKLDEIESRKENF